MKNYTCDFCEQVTITLTRVTTIIDYPTSKPADVKTFRLCPDCAVAKFRRQSP
jgi:rubredoxin